MTVFKKYMIPWLLILLAAGPLFGQSTSSSKVLERIARDQQNIKQRLQRISQKMERLANKSELEGKQHTADLIRRAREAVEERNIVKRIEELDQKIKAAQLTVDEEQRLLLQDLEDIFAILQDRNDLERVQDIIASVLEGIERIEGLIEEQGQLLEQTRELTGDQASLRASNLERLGEIIDGQEELAKATAELDEAARDPAGPEAESERALEETSINLAGRQDFLENEMRELTEKMAAQEQSSDASESGGMTESKRAEAALQEMKQAKEGLKQQEPGRSLSHQQAALEQLKALEKSMQEKQSSESAARDPAMEAQREQKFQELAEQQKELEERTRDLMRRLRELPDPAMKQNLLDGADNMAGASAALNENKGEEAENDQEEAKKHLEKALNELMREETKYQNIRQQEVLFRVRQALEAVKAEQDSINAETADFDLARGLEQRLNRLQRKNVRALVQREQEVRVKATEIKEKLEEDEATVFSWVLDRNVQDLDEVIDFLNRQKTDPLVQNIQQDISDRFAELIEALKLEMKRRSEAISEEPPSGPQQQQKNPLIPPVAELLMIKRLEENALRRLNDFVRLHPEILNDGADPLAIQMLERLGHRHTNITELFTRMVERAGGPAGGSESPFEKK